PSTLRDALFLRQGAMNQRGSRAHRRGTMEVRLRGGAVTRRSRPSTSLTIGGGPESSVAAYATARRALIEAWEGLSEIVCLPERRRWSSASASRRAPAASSSAAVSEPISL